jgi:hypothetical protein
MLDAALSLRAAGLSVFPVRNKIPLVKWEEFQGRHAAEDEIRAWYEQWPDAGVGVATGELSNLVVLDVDAAIEDPVAWVHDHHVPTTLAIKTPRGGLHLYYTWTGEQRNRAALTIGGVKCDIRGDGGYVVSPPTSGYARLPYWKHMAAWRPFTGTTALATCLADLDLSTADDLFAPAPEGGRNHAAARLAGYLLKTCRDPEAAYVQLRQWNGRNPSPLPDYELRRTFDSIARREAGQFREDGRSLVMNSVGNALHLSTTGAEIPQIDWLEGAAWADLAANTPERNGQRLACVPICAEHKGFEPGDLITLAGRQGVGKTSLLANMFWEIGKGLAESAFFFSGDMTPAQLLQSMTQGRLERGHYDHKDWQESLTLLRESRMAIKYSGFIATERIQQVLEHRPGTRYVVVDHFNKVRTGSDTRATDLKRVAADLKHLAGQYGCTVIVLSQLNRLADNVEHLMPSHLSESDALVSESDVIYGLSCVGDRTQQDPEKATIRLALLKNRFGREFVEQIAWFHKAAKRFEWLRTDVNWRDVQ